MIVRRRCRPPCWDAVNDEALREPGLLARVIAATDLEPVMDTEWGRLPWFPPPYVRVRFDAARLPPLDHSIRDDVIAGYRARRGQEWAPLNRSLRYTPAYLLRVPGPFRVIAVESFQGSWRSYDGANHGNNLLTLAGWRWGVRYDHAGARIAKIVGIDVPHMEVSDGR